MAELVIHDPNGRTTVIPTYTCGHCSDVVLMRTERTRPRVRCLKCMKYICERRPLCTQECTPIHALARDHFEGHAAALVPAIMNGAQTLNEAIEKRWVLGPDGRPVNSL